MAVDGTRNPGWGTGFNSLFGGAGKDTVGRRSGFRHVLVRRRDRQRAWTETTRDYILDFESGDRIDLSKIDANTKNGTADDAFALIGTDVAFAGVPPASCAAMTSANGQIVEGDVNGDGKADFSIALFDPTHSYSLTQAASALERFGIAGRQVLRGGFSSTTLPAA